MANPELMRRPHMKREKGFILFIALTMLALMTIIGVALVRAVDTTNEVATNIGFAQSALISGDSGLEAATGWLQNNPSLLNADSADEGYYARDVERLAVSQMIDYTGSATPGDTSDDVDWDGSGSGPYKARKMDFSGSGIDTAGNQVAYIIHRLCDNYGSPGASGIRCARMSLAATGGSSKSGAGGYGGQAISTKTQVYYRVTTRAQGPRNTASFTQSTIVIEY
jgi:Tfp pilus assembly protein PilX